MCEYDGPSERCSTFNDHYHLHTHTHTYTYTHTCGKSKTLRRINTYCLFEKLLII